MALDRETLWWLLDRTYSNNKSLFWSLWIKHSKIILWKFFPIQRSGMSTSFLWDLSFLSGQIFPDITSGEFLSIPYSDRVRSYMQAKWRESHSDRNSSSISSKGFIYTSLAEKWYYSSKSYTSAKEILSKYGWGKRNQPKTQTLPQMGAYRCHRTWLCSMGGGIHELGDKGLWDSEFWHILFAPNTGNSLKSDWFLGSGSVLYREISPENNFHSEDTWSKQFED